MNGYEVIVFDADDTLVDYKSDAVRAFRSALRAVGKESGEALAVCLEFDYGNWERVGLSDVHLPHIQESFHDLYLRHVYSIFEHADKLCGLGGRTEGAAEAFLSAFSEPGTPVEGAEETVRSLAKKYRVFAATNGLSRLQHGRLSAFPLEGVFVSEELGAIKPSPLFFDGMKRTLGVPKEKCLMIGDSLASDVAGARAAGMDCIWFNRKNSPLPANPPRTVNKLADLLPLLL